MLLPTGQSLLSGIPAIERADNPVSTARNADM